MKNWSRNDTHNWWREMRRQLLIECGCEDEDVSLYSNDIFQPEEHIDLFPIVNNLNSVEFIDYLLINFHKRIHRYIHIYLNILIFMPKNWVLVYH